MYGSNDEEVNDSIQREQKNKAIRAKLIHSEKGGFTIQTCKEILDEIKNELELNE